MQGGKQQRQGRLGHARGRRERLGEGAQTFALAELCDEGMQDRLVHDERPNQAVRPSHRIAERPANRRRRGLVLASRVAVQVSIQGVDA